MAKPKKLSRADVHNQIDAFRGILKRNSDGKLSAEQWVETRRAENGEHCEAKSKKPAKMKMAAHARHGKAISAN